MANIVAPVKYVDLQGYSCSDTLEERIDSPANKINDTIYEPRDYFNKCRYSFINDTMLVDFHSSTEYHNKFWVKIVGGKTQMLNYDMGIYAPNETFPEAFDLKRSLQKFSIKTDTTNIQSGIIPVIIDFEIKLDVMLHNHRIRTYRSINDCCKCYVNEAESAKL